MAYTSVFNLFGEVEPFAAILIAHRTHVFFRRVTPGDRGPKFEAEGQERGGILGRSPLPTS